MLNQNQEILAIIVLGVLLGILLVSFIVGILFLYKKKQQQHVVEMTTMQEEYDQQILRVQFEMQEATLKEISHKLHDAVKGNINGIILDIEATLIMLLNKKIDILKASNNLKENTIELAKIREEIRLTSHSLSSDKIARAGLIDAIKHEANRIKNGQKYKVSIIANDVNEVGFKKEESVYLFRMFQVIIDNIIAHSKATTIDIVINIDNENWFLLQVADNGIGFNVEENAKSKSTGIGLSGLQNRALQMGANLEIISLPNIGSTIKIKLLLTEPINNNKNVAEKRKTNYSFN